MESEGYGDDSKAERSSEAIRFARIASTLGDHTEDGL